MRSKTQCSVFVKFSENFFTILIGYTYLNTAIGRGGGIGHVSAHLGVKVVNVNQYSKPKLTPPVWVDLTETRTMMPQLDGSDLEWEERRKTRSLVKKKERSGV
jgi:hypothetical protein